MSDRCRTSERSSQSGSLPIDRRSLLKGIGAAGLIGAGTATASAGDSGTSGSDGGFTAVEATASDVLDAIESGEATAESIVEQYLERIEVYDEALDAIITVNPDAVERAEELDAKYEDSGAVGPLHGVPVVLKDNYDTGDMPTTNGSLSMKESQPPDDGFLVQQLREAGGVVVAKANLDEFARGIEGSSSYGGQTRNAYALGRNPSGSSAGTGASIAASLGVIGTGSDTCGSIRNPSAFGSLVGIRPTLGLLSRDGIVPLNLERDTGGPMCRTVHDAALALDVMAGYDPNDPITARGADEIPAEDDQTPEDSYTEYLDEDGPDGVRVGVLRDFFGPEEEILEGDEGDEEDEYDLTVAEAKAEAVQVTAVIETALHDMSSEGAEIVELDTVPNLDELLEEADSPDPFKQDLNAYLEDVDNEYDTLEEIVESDKYSCDKAESLRESEKEEDPNVRETDEFKAAVAGKFALRDAVEGLMLEEDVDVLAYPTLSHPPAEIGAEQPGSNCSLSAYSRLPAIVVPAGYTEDKTLPVGLELLGFEFDEPTLIEAAYAYEQATENREQPDGFGPLPAEAPDVPSPDYTVDLATEDC
ncbi:Asp-tRNAAsn/Glu-tRNAGln amidotransferase A subunit [Halopelagius inordinatus]|uniref:Asp-tRNAAsn/Glu-tRNAGln amidotransferase A subunit n=1 Tax=Halopelagius inordinatus TaxID=553467 RepID=A0A1I2S2N3_9EURY|nr:amidase family protein [Halopelagius inordinatus]SFG45077.1 Asp-tRNAAsn/Glu-tRNAGln amidotransferase A subunit [Halopelagius inordinatus]